MIVTHYVTIDLQDKGAVSQIDATQDDQYTRDLAIRLMEGDSAWTIPEDAAVVIRYCKSDGVGGEYDTMPDGSAAWSAEGNVLRLALAPQVLTCPGTVMLSATMIREAEVLSIFSVAISVRPRVRGIFAESEAYYNVSGFLPGPVKAEKGQYLRIARVDSRGRVLAVEGANAPAGGSVSTVEPAEEDIPKVFFGAALPQTKDDTIMSFRYISKTEDISGYCKTKAQGNSSMSYPKKNQTVKLYKDADCAEKMEVDFKGWGKQNKFCFKANWIDLTHARNIVSARLWGDVVKSRANYDTIPELMRTSPNQGAVDGFPVKVYANGIYQGRYTLNIPKDAWMANMDDELDVHCILCGENYVSGCFRAEANIDESDWTDEVHDTVPAAIKNRWNDAIRFVMNSTDEEFVAGIGHYFDIPSMIDYYIFGVVSCGLDAFGKNQLYMTYDGMKWYATMYDMDSTWGLWWSGSKFVPASYAREEFQDCKDGDGNLLYIRMEELFAEDIYARWEELKTGALSVENIINRFERFTDIAPLSLVEEDYAATTAEGAFTAIPQIGANNIQQLRSYIHDRRAYCDLKLNPPEGALYPFADGSKHWQVNEAAVDLEVTNGNHAKLSSLGVIDKGVFANLSTPAANTDNIASISNIGAGNPKFTLHSGDEVRVIVKHSAGSETSTPISIYAGVYRLSDSQKGDSDITVVLDQDVPVPDFGMGLYAWGSTPEYKRLWEFDIEIYVNGVRYV